jgi:selenoprotein W-related protein
MSLKKSGFGKVEVEIVYCVPCGYQAMAMWMLTEFWRSQNPGDIAIKLTPDAKGKLEVYLDGKKIYDKKEEGVYPNLTRVNELKMVIAERIFEIDEEVAARV